MLKATLFSRRDIDSAQWDVFVQASPQRSVYTLSWYLDVVCPDWSAVVAEEDGHWQAVMPINLEKKLGQYYALPPFFTQHLGVLTAPDAKPGARVFHRLRELEEAIISGIPDTLKLFRQNFHPSIQYLLPFHWAGFTLSPRFTYWLDLSGGINSVRDRYTKGVRSDLTRAKREKVVLQESDTPAVLAKLLRSRSYIGEKEEDTLLRLWEQVRNRNMGKVIHAVSPDGEVLCAAMFLFAHGRMTYLLSASGDQPRNGGNTLILDAAFEEGVQRGMTVFDFEGSMIRPVEEYFRSFNPDMQIYFEVIRDRMPAMVKWGYEARRKLKGG